MEVSTPLEAAAPVSLAYDTLTLLTTSASMESVGEKYLTEPSSTALLVAEKSLTAAKSMATELSEAPASLKVNESD